VFYGPPLHLLALQPLLVRLLPNGSSSTTTVTATIGGMHAAFRSMALCCHRCHRCCCLGQSPLLLLLLRLLLLLLLLRVFRGRRGRLLPMAWRGG
jgi:hypothetical protein